MLYAKVTSAHPIASPFTPRKRTVRSPWRWWLLAACLALMLAPGGAGAADLTNTGTISGNWTGTSDPDTMTNESTGSVSGSIIANDNSAASSSGGSNIIMNHGSVDGNIRGSYNTGEYSSGGGNEINNFGTVDLRIFGSHNTGVGSSGGGNTISNSGTGYDFFGSRNEGYDTSGGGNTITNSGAVENDILGSDNYGDGSSGGGNTITNSGTVRYCIYGSYNYGDGSSGGSNIISNSGTVYDIYGSFNSSYGTGSSGGGNIITNSGTVSRNISGNNSYGYGTGSCSGGGNTIINSGTVGGNIYGSRNFGRSSSSGNTIINSGTVGGSIYGSRNYDIDSSGGDDSITNTGTVGGGIYGDDGDDAITNSGSVAGDIEAGTGNDTVIMETSSSSVGGVVDGGDGDDTLGFSRMGTIHAVDYISNADYVNFEHIGIYSGPTILAGDWDLGALTFSVESGGVGIIAGGTTLTTPTATVKSDGMLGGNGLIVGDLINYGTIAPGNSIGTLTVNGNFINQGGWLVMELGPNGNDLLRVAGTATLNGGYLRASLRPDLYVDNQTWTVLTADSVVGSFDGFINQLNSATLSLSLTYSDNSVGVSISRKPYADFAANAAARVVGAALDDIIPLAQSRGEYMADLIIAMDFGYSAAQITDALQALAPDKYPAYALAQLESASLAADAVDAHLDQARSGRLVSTDTTTTGSGISVWARAVGAKTSLDASGGWQGYDQTWGGIVSGADFAITPNSRLGLALGYTTGSLSWDDSSRAGDIRTLHLLAYGCGRLNDFYAQASAGVAWHEADAQRDVDFAGFSGKAHSEPGAASYLAGIKGGYDFQVSGWRLGPLAGMRYIHLEQDGFRESGAGDYGLNIDSTSADSLISTLGFSASTRLDLSEILVLPRLGLAWQHELADDPIGVTAWFQDYQDVPMVFSGQERPTERLVLDAGLDIHLTKRWQSSLAFNQTLGDGYSASALSLSLEYSF